MRRINRWITLVLAVAAAVSWLAISVLPGFVAVFSYPAVQIPMAITLSAAACMGWLLLWLGEQRGDGETRCRRCGYILRGLSEPRCPECGERI
jgi:preprotein translocase subunit SecY